MVEAAEIAERVEVARYTSALTPASSVEEALVSVHKPAASQDPAEDVIPLNIEREALKRSWDLLKKDLEDKGKNKSNIESPPKNFDTLIQTARDAQTELKSKKRIWNGKPKEYYNKFCEKAHEHKAVFKVFPQSNQYISVFCGVIETLVKASVNYIKISEGLSQALDCITDYVESARRQVDNLPSTYTIKALARLYKEIFLYLKDITEWFTAQRRVRMLRSFNEDLSEKYAERLNSIQLASQNVHQVFVVENFISLQKDRPATEVLEQDRQKHTEDWMRDVKKIIKSQDQKIESLLEALSSIWYREAGLRASGMLEGVYRTETWQQDQVLRIHRREIDEKVITFKTKQAGYLEDDVPVEYSKHYSRDSLLFASQGLETFILGSSVEILNTLPPSSFAAIAVAQKIQEWLASEFSVMLWVRGMPGIGYPTVFSNLAGSLINAAIASKNSVVFHFCEPLRADQLAQGLTMEQAGMISLVYSLIRQLIMQLDDQFIFDTTFSQEQFLKLGNPLQSWSTALSILSGLLSLAPSLLICVVDGIDRLDYGPGSTLFAEFFNIIRNRGQYGRKKGQAIKCLFTSNGYSKILDESLSCEEIVYDRTPLQARGTFGMPGSGQQYLYDNGPI